MVRWTFDGYKDLVTTCDYCEHMGGCSVNIMIIKSDMTGHVCVL